MLSIKNLVKVYKTKGGAEVRALDGVSVDFPEKGMVFLLGKSGSGKSTLLNVAGGLDRPDSGEVIVKGKSSKSFSAADFDSYRNTYVGFVFQEYNILDEFNIEQNIALALQLQGKKNDKDAVNALLAQVDLNGLGKRKPNTLSGGQKQRVAIARALIKEPEIIMADEPTGALDSNTGKQVFDTLKKLSADKLVIVVSHDREFAEQYADRIIELKDGKILSDTSKALAAPKTLSANVNAIGADTVRVKNWNKLTQDDFNQIWSMMKGQDGEVIITSSAADMPAIKRVCKIADDGSKEYFKDTDRSAVKAGQYDASRTKFIKSKMPLSRAVKMGASGLKTKPVRLFFTILLSVLSFAMFGVLSTMMMYDPIYSVADALQNSPFQSATLSKKYNGRETTYRVYKNGNKEEEYGDEKSWNTLFGEDELKGLNNNDRNLYFAGVYNFNQNSYISDPSFSYNSNLENSSAKNNFYSSTSFFGFTECGGDYMRSSNFEMLGNGKYPTALDEIAVSNYVFDQFKDCGYISDGKSQTISNYNDLIGKTLTVRSENGRDSNVKLKITGIYNVGSLGDFEQLKEKNSSMSPKEEDDLNQKFSDVLNYSYFTLGYVAPGFYEKYNDKFGISDNGKDNYVNSINGRGVMIERGEIPSDYEVDEDYIVNYYAPDTVKTHASSFKLYTANGDVKSGTGFTMGEKGIYLPVNELYNRGRELNDYWKYVNVYIDRNGNTVGKSNDAQDQWEYFNGFYADGYGHISLTEKDGYAFVANGFGYVNEAGVYSDNPSEGWNCNNGKYYTDQNNRIHLTRDDPSWKEEDGPYYERNGEYTLDPNAGWFHYQEYIATGADGKTLINGLGYETRSEFYADDQGHLSLNNINESYKQYSGFYTDADGNVSLEQTEQYDQYVRGFWLNENGDVSLEKKPGYVFLNQYCRKYTDNSIVLGRIYNGYFSDGKQAVCDQYYGLVFQDYKQKRYGEEHPEFEAALMRFGNMLGYNNDNSDDETDYSEYTDADLKAIVTALQSDYMAWTGLEQPALPDNYYAKNAKGQTDMLSVAGYFIISDSYGGAGYILSDIFMDSFAEKDKYEEPEYTYVNEITTDYVAPKDAKFNFAISLTQNTQEQTHFMLDERENGVVFYTMNNSVYKSVNNMGSMIESMKLIFLIAGAVMAVLSALMLFNFISVSISAKRKEIGILRAVGARGSDVFKIFFAEAFIIAIICFVFAAVGAGVACFIMNGIFISSAVATSVLNYGVLQVLLILGIALVVSFIATILPVYFAAKKPPVESIRAL